MAGSESDILAVRVVYSGHVQGVGFRFNTLDAARGFDVDGYVRNMPDGTVELLARGEAGQVEQFLAAVSHRMRSYIADATREAAPPTQAVPSPFEIRM